VTDLPRVSVVVLAHNYGRFLADAIDSLLDQDYSGELDLIVVDDGSTDNTREVAAGYADRLRYIHQENQGVAGAANTGLAAATGELIAFHSADDVALPGKLHRQAEILTSRPEVGLVYGDMAVTDATLTVIDPSFWASQGIVPVRGDALERALVGPFVSGGTMMFRARFRDAFYPLPAWAQWEDWWITVHVAAFAEFEFIPEPLILYRQHGANMILGGTPDLTPGVRMHEWIAENRQTLLAHAEKTKGDSDA
jgi:glycosyltransferase involved in cell wall biosynthesis